MNPERDKRNPTALARELRRLGDVYGLVGPTHELVRQARELYHGFDLKRWRSDALGQVAVHREDPVLGRLTTLQQTRGEPIVAALILATQRILGELINQDHGLGTLAQERAIIGRLKELANQGEFTDEEIQELEDDERHLAEAESLDGIVGSAAPPGGRPWSEVCQNLRALAEAWDPERPEYATEQSVAVSDKEDELRGMMRLREVARYLAINPGSLSRYAKQGKIRSKKLGQFLYLDLVEAARCSTRRLERTESADVVERKMKRAMHD